MVYDCCMFVVVVGAVGAECAATLPSVCPRAAVASRSMTVCEWMEPGTLWGA